MSPSNDSATSWSPLGKLRAAFRSGPSPALRQLSFNNRPQGLLACLDDGGSDSDSRRILQRTSCRPSDLFVANFSKQMKMGGQLSLQQPLPYARGYLFDKEAVHHILSMLVLRSLQESSGIWDTEGLKKF